MSKHQHEHEQRDTQEMVQEMVRAMSNKGWRITDQRKSLATLFAEAEGYLSPKDVYESMRQKYPGVSFDTVYRNLRLLSEMGVLEQFYLNDGVKFRARCQTHHHHHMICLQCEKTVTFEFCPMKQVPNLPDGFQVVNHRFEIFGYCDECAAHATTRQ
ncbi:transcriptional repressor [Paenibacillus doosanensis]|uniref:Zinc-specific metallo-regulatory protein n=1 Tax=Paenibacillus konkukensis TaxID=2020716 RepID=A0ABY4RJ11_9BACL|nr:MULTISPECIES: Fur family transcriptional regulator [Paenibacillus]MCS7464686.1 transcriptional repressor [Paenibacillus doosanensis]UQZ81538.1 Zinc-specific metallo-regulatory protein [Paenibacillus konkukensis]